MVNRYPIPQAAPIGLLFLLVVSLLAIANKKPVMAENTSGGSLTIVKSTVPQDGTNFYFTFNLPPPPAAIPVSIADRGFYLDDANPDDGDEYGNSYTFGWPISVLQVREVGVWAWQLQDITCSGATSSEVLIDLERGTITVDLVAGEQVTCTFSSRPFPFDFSAHMPLIATR